MQPFPAAPVPGPKCVLGSIGSPRLNQGAEIHVKIGVVVGPSFRHIQAHSGTFRHVQAHSGTFRQIQAYSGTESGIQALEQFRQVSLVLVTHHTMMHVDTPRKVKCLHTHIHTRCTLYGRFTVFVVVLPFCFGVVWQIPFLAFQHIHVQVAQAFVGCTPVVG
jgi:hypothetical protein